MNGSPPASFTSCVTHGNRDRLVTTTIAATDLQSRQSRSLPVNSRKLQPAVDPGPREEKQTYYSCLAAPTFFLSPPPSPLLFSLFLFLPFLFSLASFKRRWRCSIPNRFSSKNWIFLYLPSLSFFLSFWENLLFRSYFGKVGFEVKFLQVSRKFFLEAMLCRCRWQW